MEEMNQVKLHGMWASTYSKRVELALKIKGILYEYVEEDLSNKSELLLKYNPVHKKVPVLVHNGKPIAESMIILEYIDETWNNTPKLLPDDPYKRAKVKFWASFIQHQLFDSMVQLITAEGKTQQKAVDDVQEKLKILEEGIQEFYPEGGPSMESKNLGLLDILLVATFGQHKAYEHVTGVKLLDPVKTPLIFSWVTTLSDLPMVEKIKSPQDKIIELLQNIRRKHLARVAE